ncbi:D-glycerate dehydrogenase [Priestia aryabhattai]|uniref:2-hydroxyacid dehydrogenase n=1 Tax=Priestia aryabhattai TaxID=412384 RepID=UPI002378BACA|nr:D-glycerate dehydrogenase [Priestia aryabhattai]WDL87738.1 D-glycerate dehydrogenase [Priestia aryabhattai]
MYNIIVYRKIPVFLLKRLKREFNVTYFEEITKDNQKEFDEQLKKVHGLLGTGMKITKEILDKAPNLRAVSNFSAGYDNFNLDELTKRGIIATNISDALTDTTADLIFGLLLSTARRITELDRNVRKEKWEEEISKEYFGMDVHHKTIGIIGMGRIGRAVAKRAALGFDMKVLYTKRKPDLEAEKELGAIHCNLNKLISSADYICLTIPLTKETHYLINEEELNKMKSTAVLINGGRGQLVCEKALIKALKKGTIRAAGLDVFEKEPLSKESALLTIENVVITPHIGSATEETRNRMVAQGVDNLLQALNGEVPKNLLNPSVLISVK